MDPHPFAPSSGVPLAMGRFSVDRHVVALARQARAVAAHFGVPERDILILSASIHEAARRLRDAGAHGDAEIALAPGPSLRVVFRVVESPTADPLSRALQPLRRVVPDLTIAHASNGTTVEAKWLLPASVAAPVAAAPAFLDGASHAVSAAAVFSSPASALPLEQHDPSSASLQCELDLAARAAVALAAELAVVREQLEQARGRASSLQKRLEGRTGHVAAANRAIEEFLSMLSHELRTPLNAMLGWTKLLRMGYLDHAGTARALDALERSARVQAQLVADILDASRIVTGQLQLELRSVGLAAIVDGAVDFLRPQADAKQIALETSIQCCGQVSGDTTRLQQVANNLLSNAIKFTPEGGRIRVSLVRSDGAVTLTVSDSGQGIDQAFLPFVFERFRQGDSSSTRSYGGLGLGLSIVRHIVELHGGRIDVASDGPGRGASFSVHLPVGE